MTSRPFRLLAIAAVVLLGTLGISRAVVGGSAAAPDAALPFLIAAGALCVAGLSARRQPTIAWLAIIAALTTITIDLAALGRQQRPLASAETWQWMGIAIAVSAITATTAAAAYAANPAHRFAPWAAPLAGVAVLAVFSISAWALATPDASSTIDGGSPLGDLGLVTRAFLILTVGLTALTVIAELRPAAHRASRRLAITGATRRETDGELRYGIAWLEAFVDELSPGRERARRAAGAERARLARDLHAVVVPDLRRAIREAERAGSLERVAAPLRDALDQVEAMMESRDTVGLDLGGLVPALESLAERTEERSDVRVTIDVLDGPDSESGPPPREVEAAALRIATLALDNVVRHAPASSVRLTVMRRAGRVRLSIDDDGPGVSRDRARPDAGRGLADMATEAAACGATLQAGAGEGGAGMRIAFDWPAA
jgi:signal transduction histidine kinase